MQIKPETAVGFFVLAAIASFLYMSFHVGFFRVDKAFYVPYTSVFKDVTGLVKKADIKIAGVKVGWVDSIDLADDGHSVKAKLLIHHDYVLRENANAIVRQEGILGNKYLEVFPGTGDLKKLSPGGNFAPPSKNLTSVDDVIYDLKGIAQDVQEITKSLKEVFASKEGALRVKNLVDNFSDAAKNISGATGKIENLIVENSENFKSIVSGMSSLAEQLKNNVPDLTQNINAVAKDMHEEFLPGISNNVDRFVGSFDATSQEIKKIAEELNCGKGSVGKLLKDDCIYEDLKCTVSSVKNTFSGFSCMSFLIDSHFEGMMNRAECFDFNDFKTFLNFRWYPCPDAFVLIGATISQKGYMSRRFTHFDYYDTNCEKIVPQNPQDSALVANIYKNKDKRDSITLNLQVSKVLCKNVGLRFGLFEGTIGLGLDYGIPFCNDWVQWITSLQIYDFKGRNRFFNDNSAHFKWLNKIVIVPGVYLSFGVDDFVSKHDSNFFLGLGVRFGNGERKET